MSWTGYTYKGFPYAFMRRRGAVRDWRRMLRGVGRGTRSVIRAARPRTHTRRRGCCCCPVFFVLGLAGLGTIAGFLYLGIRFLGWA
jgi:hypothetical protein